MTDWLKIGYDVKNDKPVLISLQEIIKSRLLFQANSGGGKSYIVRKFLEESHGLVQQIIIDPEGEFHTLREKYEYLLIGKGSQADIQIDTRHAELLSRRLLETGANAIIDLYELSPFERIRFVKMFVDSLVNSPKNLWHPVIIVIDEIHTYAPEASKGRSESLEAVASLASRGRKRGYALVGATQKLSKFHKDVAAELNTKFTGRCVLDIDQKRAGQELGMKDYTKLRELKHEFYAFGPALKVDETVKVKAYKVQTTHEDIGSARTVKVASRDKIKKILTQFVELPQEAENELRTKQDMTKKINELTFELRKTRSEKGRIDPQAIEKSYSDGYGKALKHANFQYENTIKKLEGYIKAIKANAANIKYFLAGIEPGTAKQFSLILHTEPDLPKKPISNSVPKLTFREPILRPPSPTLKPASDKFVVAPVLEEIKLDGPQTKVLTGIIQCPNHRGSRKRIALYCGYAVKGGAFGNTAGKLRSSGLIQYEGSELVATDQGVAMIPNYDPLPTEPEEIISFWSDKLGKAKGKILRAVFEENPISREALAETTGYAESGGAFSNILGNLRTLGLIDYLADRKIGISKELFPELII